MAFECFQKLKSSRGYLANATDTLALDRLGLGFRAKVSNPPNFGQDGVPSDPPEESSEHAALSDR